ncbi:MAG TPA: hypothetical protein VKK81_18205 [Candidatus Binatia bacterium]|nr:hypothetical protein [Candidatus Binatia bacterium]
MLPAFNGHGNLPEGIHPATEEEVFARFAAFSVRRRWLGERLRDLITTAKTTGKLARLILWGSFVTAKESPNDLDLLLVMNADFDLAEIPEETRALFDHTQARLRFHADVFWTKMSMDPGILNVWLDTYQVGKDFTRRGIVEVAL